jgi:hypothetical protein
MQKILLIRSNSNPEEPYRMLFEADGDGLKLRCYCPAGTQQMLCKHVIDLLAGDREILFPTCEPELFDEVLALAEKVGAVYYCQQMNLKIKELEREFKKNRSELKDKLCDTLREGGLFA